MRAMQTFMITSVTCHQQCFSTRNTKVNGRNNAVPIMHRVAWHLPERSPETGVAMRRELIVNVCVFIEYPKLHIYSPKIFYFI
jgi:hypothetical protein